MIRKSIPSDVEQPPSSLLPHRLDKPVHTATSCTYADILKQQFSLTPNATKTTNDHSQPPRKRQAVKLDYDSDQSTEFTVTTNVSNANNSTGTTTTTATPTPTLATEMLSIKTELAQLKDIIATAVAQIKDAITTLRDANCTTSTPATTMEDDKMDSATDAEYLTPQDIQSFIYDLKQELATFFIETRAMVKQQPLPQPTTKNSQPKT